MAQQGIADALSDRIIKYRKGESFNKIEDIMGVKYIKLARFGAIKDKIIV
jgi:DNA uptake protein ComE-like DNA-binding protein